MERDPIANEVRALARKVGLAGYESEEPTDQQTDVLASLRELGAIAEMEQPEVSAAATAAPAAPAPVAAPISTNAVRRNASRLESLLMTLSASPADKPISEHVRREVGHLLKVLRN